VIVFHDLNPIFFAFQPYVERALGERLAVFDGGMERRPASAQSLAQFVAERPGTQVVCARYVQPAIAGAPAETMRSVVSVAHPILRMLRRIETTWTRFAGAHASTLMPRAAMPPNLRSDLRFMAAHVTTVRHGGSRRRFETKVRGGGSRRGFETKVRDEGSNDRGEPSWRTFVANLRGEPSWRRFG